MLNRSLNPVPISSSLMSGLPIRWIWLQEPADSAGSGARRVVSLGLDVVAQTPMVAAVELAASIAPVFVNIEIGTSMAIEFTAYPETVSLARFTLLASSAAERTGGDLWVFKVSKAPPRSIQKPSSVVPAKVLIPLVVVVIAAL